MASTSLSDQHQEPHEEILDSPNIVQVADSANGEQTENGSNDHLEREISLPNGSIEKDVTIQADTVDIKNFDSELPKASLSEQYTDSIIKDNSVAPQNHEDVVAEQHMDPFSMTNSNDPQTHQAIMVEHVEQAHTIDQINPSSESVCSIATLIYQDEVGVNFDQEYPAYLAPTKAFLAKRREPAKIVHQNPFRFPRHSNSEPERYEEPEEPYVPLAVRILQTALRTPSRFRRRPDPVYEAPARRVVLPQTPVLTSQYRTRATRSVEPSNTIYRANPVDRKALDSRGEVGVPRMKRRLPTIPHSPAFSSKRQRYQHFSDSDSTAVLNHAIHEVSNLETTEQETSIDRMAEIQTVSTESNTVVTEISCVIDEAC